MILRRGMDLLINLSHHPAGIALLTSLVGMSGLLLEPGEARRKLDKLYDVGVVGFAIAVTAPTVSPIISDVLAGLIAKGS